MTERTITICGKEVRMRYCAATENGFEMLRKKSIAEIDFTTQEDILTLAVCAIVSAYSRKGQEPPVNSDTILYEAKPDEIVKLITNCIELRAEWYGVPAVVKTDEQKQEDGETPKN